MKRITVHRYVRNTGKSAMAFFICSQHLHSRANLSQIKIFAWVCDTCKRWQCNKSVHFYYSAKRPPHQYNTTVITTMKTGNSPLHWDKQSIVEKHTLNRFSSFYIVSTLKNDGASSIFIKRYTTFSSNHFYHAFELK